MMFLTIFLGSGEHDACEVPITPHTLCRDVLDVCREPGEVRCYLTETWRGSERTVGEEEKMMEVLQRWGQRRVEVSYLLRPPAEPGPQLGVCRPADHMTSTGHMTVDHEVQRLRRLRHDGHQEASEQEQVQRLRENILKQEAKLQRVRALRGQVETKRLSNSKLVEEVEQMSGVLQQKQKEVLLAVTRVEELSLQLEALRSSSLLPPLSCLHATSSSSSVELQRLCRELQLRNQLNQDQSTRLQQQREGLNKKNLEVASMERRLAELRHRLWKKKAALQHQENTANVWAAAEPLGGSANVQNSWNNNNLCWFPQQVTSDSAVASKVAAVGPYIQSSCQGPVLAPHQEVVVKPAYLDGTTTLPMPDRSMKPAPWSLKAASAVKAREESSPAHASTLPRMASLCRYTSDASAPVPLRTKEMTEDLLRNRQASSIGQTAKLAPPPVTAFSTGTFPGKMRPAGCALHSHTLPLARKQESPLAATVRPYTPEPSEPLLPVLQKPQTVATASIYSVYTQHSLLGKSYQASTLPRCQPVYGKPVLPASGGQQSALSCASKRSESEGSGAEAAERAPSRPLSPTKLLPFLSIPHRSTGDTDTEALRRRHHAPRPLKKRSSITEPEGPAGPNIQKLLYQKTTLAAMETIFMETPAPGSEDDMSPPPLPPRSPISISTSCCPPSAPLGEVKEEVVYPVSSQPQDLPSSPPPYPLQGDETFSLRPPEVTGQVTALVGKKSILRKADSDPIDRSVRVKFNPLAILLDSSLEGEYDLVRRIIYDVDDPSAANDEGITALHNAVCAGHMEIVKFLVQFGVNVNAADSDGWTPLHCAASCNNVQACKFLVESGAAVFAATHSDMQTAADKCEETEDGYAQCSQFLYGVQEKMGVMNRGVVYALWNYEPQSSDELGFQEGDCMTVLKREEEVEREWWWARCGDYEGYIPRNLLGLYLRIRPRQRSLA
ncbi:apoptosis-stimulating of p53 protein 2-like isoform X2 [Dunckerocampus dactyliophorus]|uniref:apoptosis-stimulating of p53 protein 2-like isoform X2 n=1 Tax=Dunckerocampus dactyliophorus TaxID=161453 RepID=UPI002404DBAE|nr:apoptosis-stimulating of p53 protein 2-like isoform X2 [Dunckerocampus dactyliophorus]XP_054635669.1 apoptosis-stimulating of p53 protein 2-like isoform X2 [Dunckerocampus dactyliophorus]